LVLWRKPRNPPSVVAYALDPGVDATAAARPEFLHGNSPSTLDARVPATKDQAHDHTARLTIHSSQPGVSTAHSSKRIPAGTTCPKQGAGNEKRDGEAKASRIWLLLPEVYQFGAARLDAKQSVLDQLIGGEPKTSHAAHAE